MGKAPSRPIQTVDAAFRSLLKHFGDRRKAVSSLKDLVLWGHKDGRWFETDIDRAALYYDTYETDDGWRAKVKMQPGRIGTADFDAYYWAFAAEDVDRAKAASDKQSEETPGKKKRVLPRLNWPQIDPVIRYYNATRHLGTAPKQQEFIESIREWCRREGWKVPAAVTIDERIQVLKRRQTDR
jgi:hypothetical protein